MTLNALTNSDKLIVYVEFMMTLSFPGRVWITNSKKCLNLRTNSILRSSYKKLIKTPQRWIRKWRDCIPSKIRLAVTLRFLASGVTGTYIICLISSQVTSKIVQEVCAALCQVLKDSIKVAYTLLSTVRPISIEA